MISRLAAAIVYSVVVVPVGMLVRLLGDPLRARRPPRASNWVPLEPPEISPERARQML